MSGEKRSADLDTADLLKLDEPTKVFKVSESAANKSYRLNHLKYISIYNIKTSKSI